MKRVSIERYNTALEDVPLSDGLDPDRVSLVQDWYSGLIEGERDDGSTWIMFLDQNGSPQLFWGLRDEDGGVVGDPIRLC